MDPDPYSSPDQRWGGPSVSATLLRDVMLMLGRDMYQLRSEVCHVLRVYLNRPSRAASPMSCLFRGSSMNFGSARISAVTMVPSPPWLRADRPPPAGASPGAGRPCFLPLHSRCAASLAAVVVAFSSWSNA